MTARMPSGNAFAHLPGGQVFNPGCRGRSFLPHPHPRQSMVSLLAHLPTLTAVWSLAGCLLGPGRNVSPSPWLAIVGGVLSSTSHFYSVGCGIDFGGLIRDPLCIICFRKELRSGLGSTCSKTPFGKEESSRIGFWVMWPRVRNAGCLTGLFLLLLHFNHAVWWMDH